MRPAIKRLIDALNTTIASIFWAGVLLLALNYLAELYLRHNPTLVADDPGVQWLLDREQNTPADKIASWYDLKSPDELPAMLKERFSVGVHVYEPYTEFRQSYYIGRYYGASEGGYRLSRERGPWPPDRNNFNVFFFGNSTAFGVGPYWSTVASYLQDLMNERAALSKKVFVYNFGRPGYISTQEQILFLQLLKEVPAPNMAIFLDGLADFCFYDGYPSGWQAIAARFNRDMEDRAEFILSYGVGTDWNKISEFYSTLPLIRVIDGLINRAANEHDAESEVVSTDSETPIDETLLRKVIERYYNIVRQTRAIGKAYNTQTVFVWQPFSLYEYDPKDHPFYPKRLGCQINTKAGYPLLARAVAEKPIGPDFIWAADIQKDLHEPLYADGFHYTAPMSRRLASFVLDQMLDRGLVLAANSPHLTGAGD